MKKIVIDSNFLIGIINRFDHRHAEASRVILNLLDEGFEIVIFDCVVSESISNVLRRLFEKQRFAQIHDAMDGLLKQFPAESVTWTGHKAKTLYKDIIELIKKSDGEMNYNDALIALLCRDFDISLLLSADRDFDQIEWITRIEKLSDIPTYQS